MTHASLVVRGPDVLPAAIPHLVGFHPLDSLVIIGLSPGSRRVLVTVRVDLPPPEEELDDVLEAWSSVVAALLRVGALEAIVAVFPAPADDPWTGDKPTDLPHRPLVRAVMAELEDAVVSTLDAVCIVGQRLRSYLCEDLACCPAQGRQVDDPEALRLTAAFVAEGSAPLASRAELVETLAPRDPDDPVHLSVDSARDGVVVRLPAGIAPRVERFVDDLRSWADNPRNERTLVRLVVVAGFLTSTVRSRDLLLRALTIQGDHDLLGAARQVLAEAVRCARPPETAPLAAVLAVCCWVDGDGAAAWVALDRAFGADPAYSLAALVAAALDAGAPPGTWTAMMAELSEEEILGVVGGADESWSA